MMRTLSGARTLVLRFLPLFILVTAACGGPRALGGAGGGVAPAAEPVMPPPTAQQLADADSVLVRFSTTKGEFDLMARRSWSPKGAVRVGEAVSAGYYDGARFFRALRGFVVQWGLAADSARSAEWSGRRIEDDAVLETNRRGTVSFAAGGKDTRTVQLFVSLRDNARLDAMGFSPIGEIVRGMDVVDALYTGYGEGAPAGQGPQQRMIGAQGEEYLAREFPLLDRIISARVVRVWPIS